MIESNLESNLKSIATIKNYEFTFCNTISYFFLCKKKNGVDIYFKSLMA